MPFEFQQANDCPAVPVKLMFTFFFINPSAPNFFEIKPDNDAPTERSVFLILKFLSESNFIGIIYKIEIQFNNLYFLKNNMFLSRFTTELNRRTAESIIAELFPLVCT